MKYGNYDKYPELKINGKFKSATGYSDILSIIKEDIACGKKLIVLDCYSEVDEAEIIENFKSLNPSLVINSLEAMISEEEFEKFKEPYMTTDRVFGVMNTKKLNELFVLEKVQAIQKRILEEKGLVILYGVGAALITKGDILIHCSVTRWEIQCRFAKGLPNWRTNNANAPKLTKYKQGFFLIWRMIDKHKQEVMKDIQYMMDTNVKGQPNLVDVEGYQKGLEQFVNRPFRLVPYFAPEVWGGQWMKEVIGLDKNEKNYAWAFDGVPEENSLFMRFENARVEIPAVDLVFFQPSKLLGERVHARFGKEFPIRFDFLDTMGGQNLSLQVHPLTEYIQQTFGMHYTQDESYYILDCDENAEVYLGLKENVNPDEMLEELEMANAGKCDFDANKYINRYKAKKHEHYLIPAGTIHCSATNTMVLEISATPYIFTFKLWDWGRLGLDGLPRPTHVNHGKHVIQWDRDTKWINENCVGQVELLEKNSDYVIEKTGLHNREFIQTVRYSVETSVELTAGDSVSMCNLVDGKSALIVSPTNAFTPFEVHYAETFIIPANVEKFVIKALDGPCKILRATVR